MVETISRFQVLIKRAEHLFKSSIGNKERRKEVGEKNERALEVNDGSSLGQYQI
jgi:hypothetical protein